MGKPRSLRGLSTITCGKGARGKGRRAPSAHCVLRRSGGARSRDQVVHRQHQVTKSFWLPVQNDAYRRCSWHRRIVDREEEPLSVARHVPFTSKIDDVEQLVRNAEGQLAVCRTDVYRHERVKTVVEEQFLSVASP